MELATKISIMKTVSYLVVYIYVASSTKHSLFVRNCKYIVVSTACTVCNAHSLIRPYYRPPVDYLVSFFFLFIVDKKNLCPYT